MVLTRGASLSRHHVSVDIHHHRVGIDRQLGLKLDVKPTNIRQNRVNVRGRLEGS